jgi:hypothetical protein
MQKHYTKFEEDAYQECPVCQGLGSISEHSGFVNPGEETPVNPACTKCNKRGKVPKPNFFEANDELAEHLTSEGFKENNTHRYKRIFTKGIFTVIFDNHCIVIERHTTVVFWHPIVYLGTLDTLFYSKHKK